MKITHKELFGRKGSGPKITMLTSYDFPTARILDRCAVDVQLIGDSVGTNVLGYDDVTRVTVADMLHHVRAVSRGVQHSFVLGDMPSGSFSTPERAVDTARLYVDNGADGVKMETHADTLEQVRAVTSAGIPICAHIGYTPQTDKNATVHGKDFQQATELLGLAHKIGEAGAFMLILELVPIELAREITQSISMPTIGIGAGPYCDGQVQVILDILGMSDKVFRHGKVFCNVADAVADAASRYVREVRDNMFPTEKNAVHLTPEVGGRIRAWVTSRT